MKVIYRKSDGAVMGVCDGGSEPKPGFGWLEVSTPGEPRNVSEIPDIEVLLRADITEKIDAKTGADIVSGMDYAGHHFRLTQEDQINYSNLYVACELMAYPLTIKAAGLDFVSLADVAAVEAFYLAGVAFVQARLALGWQQKSALATLPLADLLAYEV